jgi:hypothetical protein
MNHAVIDVVQVYEGDGVKPPRRKIVRPPKPFENEGKFRITINDITFIINYKVQEFKQHGVVTSQNVAVTGCGFGGVFTSSDLKLQEPVKIRQVMVGKQKVQTYLWDLDVLMITRMTLERFGDHLAKHAAHKKKYYKKRTW